MPTKQTKIKKRIYLDYAAGAPILPSILNKTTKLQKFYFGNPSSLHHDGVISKKILEETRIFVAALFDAHANEIIFTSSGTESNSLALCGVCEHAKKQPEFLNKKPHIITTVIEHPSILKTCEMLEKRGINVTYIPVGNDGIVSLKSIYEAILPETIIISISYANNEIGVIQPIKEIAKEIRRYKKSKSESLKSKINCYPLFHVDACQAVSYLDIGVERLGIDMLSWNGTKIGGPRGTGALYIRRHTPVSPIFFGGDQEYNMRSGTENVPGIIGFNMALNEARKLFQKENIRLGAIRDFCISEINVKFPGARINGNLNQRLSNNVNVSFKDFSSELLVLELDAKGISVSAGSACSSTKDSGSHVLKALYGNDDDKKWGSVRISLGRETKKQDIIFLIKALDNIFEKYKKTGII